ncbi:hypothetical protein ACFP3Q_09470 [Nocardioides sp. GCM10027113]|uniref:hypothetical protein n=1 Tax=unclassified Nocardioides TaxID=2615069 RepID=UPI0036208B82
MRRATTVLSLLLALGLTASCGGDETVGADDPTGTPSATVEDSPTEESSEPAKKETDEPEDEMTSIDVTVSDGTISPSGERVEVAAGEEIEFVVKADQPGELHVHSFPEQTLAYGNGTTNLRLTIDEPGVVEVEDHDLGLVVVQLEVR